MVYIFYYKVTGINPVYHLNIDDKMEEIQMVFTVSKDKHPEWIKLNGENK